MGISENIGWLVHNGGFDSCHSYSLMSRKKEKSIIKGGGNYSNHINEWKILYCP